MKRITLLLLVASLLPSCVLAWNTPGEDFSGELKLGGPVTSTRNPWVWKVGEGNTQINTKAVSVLLSGEQVIPVPLPAMTVLLGKTILTTPAGREGLAPQVIYGKGTEGFALAWTAPGTHTGLTAADNRTILVFPANSILFNFCLRLFFICVPD